jgi:hypothetical protein
MILSDVPKIYEMKPSKIGVMKLSESNKTTHPEGNMGIGHKVATAASIFE